MNHRQKNDASSRDLCALLLLLAALLLGIACADPVERSSDLDGGGADGSRLSELTQAPTADPASPDHSGIGLRTADSSAARGSTNSPITVHLEVDGQPRLHAILTVRLEIRSALDAKDTKAAIVLPRGIVKVDGSLGWEGDLEQKKPIELLARVKPVEPGRMVISGFAKHVIDGENAWGDVDYVHLDVVEDRGDSIPRGQSR